MVLVNLYRDSIVLGELGRYRVAIPTGINEAKGVKF